MRRVSYWMPVFVAIIWIAIPAVTSFCQEGTEPADPETAQVEQEQEQEKAGLLAGEETFNELNDQFESLKNAFSERSQAAREKYDAASDEEKQPIIEEMQTARQELMAATDEIGAKMLELASVEKTDQSIAFRSILWILKNSQGDETRSAAVDLMVKSHLDNPDIADALPSLARGNGLPSQATEDLLTQLAEKGATDAVRGVATINLINYLRENSEMVSGLVDNEAFAEQYADSIEYFRKLAAVDDERIEGLLNGAVEAFGDVEHAGTTIGEMAAEVLKEHLNAKRFRVGSVAPDIEGPDLDGTNFKLTDYRGKVVMLDFWGDW